jgi:hypothetical protein
VLGRDGFVGSRPEPRAMRPHSRGWFVRNTGLATLAGLVPRAARAAPAFRAEKPSLKLGVPVDAASFLPVYIAAAHS